ncbi:MAG: adenylate/guanylate cyclase domain-containing protein [Verrucomicrobia bacterium]|nr:adenylate/guanylate cyclase domain-containing protein [Verrucomicrobiota bacterium]
MTSERLKKWQSTVQRHLYTGIGPVVMLLLMWGVSHTRVFQRFENLSIDLRFKLRSLTDHPADARLILVGIDEASLKEFGGWPWPRKEHGALLQLLSPSEPAVVAFDLLFTEPREKAMDAYFGKSSAKLSSVITGSVSEKDTKGMPSNWGPTRPITHIQGDQSRIRGEDGALLPIEELRLHSYFAFVDCDPSSADGIRRHVPLLIKIGDKLFPSLSLQILCLYWKVPPDQVRVQLGKSIILNKPEGPVEVPINRSGEFLINYRAGGGYYAETQGFTSIGYMSLAKALGDHHIREKPWPKSYPEVGGRILVVGQTATGLTDLGPSPLEAMSPLVLTHMNAINNILKHDFLRVASMKWVGVGWLLIAWGTLIGLKNSKTLPSVLFPALLLVFYTATTFHLFLRFSLYVPLLAPTAAFAALHGGAIIFRWLDEQKSKQHIKSVFSSYIAPGVMEEILKHPDNIRLGGTRKPVTILFSDIRGFTTISESGDEQELVRQLNEYFLKMVDCVNLFQGTLHKYIGDAIMAVWGDVTPGDESSHAKNAVRAALAMRAQLIDLNKFWASENRMQLKIGVGLNHGHVVVGNIGAPQRMEFTVIGDAVNLASRLEGVTKQFHTDFVISESVRILLGEEFLVRTVGSIVVKGKTQPVRVFEVLDDAAKPLGGWDKSWVAAYEDALGVFLARQFEVAAQKFEQCDKERPGDYCTGEYLKSSREFIKEPPPPDWSGDWVLKTK